MMMGMIIPWPVISRPHYNSYVSENKDTDLGSMHLLADPYMAIYKKLMVVCYARFEFNQQCYKFYIDE